jgi:hypothetical protein
MFPNQFVLGLHSYMHQFLGVRYDRNQDIIERIGHTLVTEADFKNFMALSVDLYESGFMRAVDEYQQKLSKLGIKVEVETKAE